ncbi:MAG: BatA domain-containing protein [Cytophagales bacterium]|nr:BatA domain-containing protein [Cytophagales bacterium]
MMQLTQSVWLWGLLALALPIAIHLLSRKEGRVVPVGSLRHLRETTSQQFRGIKLNELLLLAVRSLLIILFVLLLAGLFWKNADRQLWVVVDHDLLQNTRAMALADSLTDKGYEWRWLESNFPKKDRNQESSSKNNWQLIDQLHTQHLQHAVLLSTGLLTEFIGESQPLGPHIDWHVFEPLERKTTLYTVEKSGNKFQRTLYSFANRTHFITDTLSVFPDSVQPVNPIRVSLVADKNFEQDARIVTAALKSIAAQLPVSIELQSALQPNTDWLMWLSAEAKPKTSAKIISTDLTQSNQLLQQQTVNQWQLTQRLSVDAALQNDFTIQLAKLITNNVVADKKISTLDNRTLPEAFFKKAEVKTAAIVNAEFNVPLLILFLLTLAAERLLAFVRKQ